MFKTKSKNTPKTDGHVLRGTPVSVSPINPVFLYECTRCGAAGTDAGDGAFRGPCRG